MDSAKKTLKDSMLDMQTNFEERMAHFESDLKKKSSNSTGIAGLAEEFSKFKSFVMQTLQNFEIQISALTSEIDNMETRSRRGILLLHGIKEVKDENTVDIVVETVRSRYKMDSFTNLDVSRCHRMGRQKSGNIPRPILIEFNTITQRNNIWSSKTMLKGTGVTVSEFLTRARHAAFMAARQKYGISKCWTREGSVFVISADGSRHRISSVDDLNNIKDVDPGKTKVTKAGHPRLKRAAISKK